MTREYWARYRKQQLGPFATRLEAIAAMRKRIKGWPIKYKEVIATGYGVDGMHFDIQWVKAAEENDND